MQLPRAGIKVAVQLPVEHLSNRIDCAHVSNSLPRFFSAIVPMVPAS